MSNDPVRCIINTVYASKECNKIRRKIIEKQEQSKKQFDSSYLNAFRDLCCSADPYTSSLTCSTIVDLVQYDNFPPLQAVSWFMSLLQSAKNIAGISTAIARLLDIRSTNSITNRSKTENQFNLTSSIHPFIYILQHDKTNWQCIADCLIKNSLSHFQFPDNCVIFDSLLPVFKFIFWSPDDTVDSGCKRTIWKYLLNLDNNLLQARREFFLQTVCWMRTKYANSILDNSHFIDYVTCNRDYIGKSIMGLWAAEVACQLAKVDYEPKTCLQYMSTTLNTCPEITDIILLRFAETIGSCPIRFLYQFLETSVELIEKYGVIHDVIVWTIIGSVLPWIIHPLNELKRTNMIVNFLFEMVDERKIKYVNGERTKTLTKDKTFATFITCNRYFYWAFTFVKMLETVSLDELTNNLNAFCSSKDLEQNPSLSLFLTGIYLYADDTAIRYRCLDLLLDAIPGQQLPLILYSLSKMVDPKLSVKLLRSLPSTAVQKENIPPILRTIRALSTSGEATLVKLSVDLHSRLWMVQDRCYSFLHDQLMSFKNQLSNDWEMDVVVSLAIRDVCIHKPDQYGKEWVAMLSDIMSRYVENHDPLPLVYALESILKLCKVNEVDVLTVYEELRGQMLFADKRSSVVYKLCEMISLVFEEGARVVDDRCQQLVSDALVKLWKYATFFSDPIIVRAALSALSNYDFQVMPLKVIPQEYLKDMKIPRQFVKKSTQNQPRPEDTISFVPGTLWLDYLRCTPESYRDDVCTLLTSWLIDEVKTFSISSFRVVRGERDNVNHLHDNSIFKTIIGYLKKASVRSKSNSILADEYLQTIVYSLKMLNNIPQKLLPPFSWYFLEEFNNREETELRKQTSRFFAKESVISMSAKTCIENLLKDFTRNIDDCSADSLSELFENVSRWCCPVSSEIITQFLSASMQHILVKSVDLDGEKLYRYACTCLSETLKQPYIDEKNRDAICRNMVNWWQNIAVDSELFEYLLIAAKALPAAYVDHISSLEDTEVVSTEELYKVLRLRCAVALSDSEYPFVWLNSCVEVTCRRLENKALFFDCVLDVLVKYRSHLSKFQWLCQLQDRIHNQQNEATDATRRFLYDVYIFCVVNTSSFHPFISKPTDIGICCEYFPQALMNIIGNEDASQVIEWLCCTCNKENIDKEQAQVFSMGIVAFKDNAYMQKLPVWSRVQDAMDHSLREKFTDVSLLA